ARPRKDRKVPKRQRPDPHGVLVTVPVAFNRYLGCGDAAFVLAEVLRHVLFMRGQLPMPYHQLLQASKASVLDEREERDHDAREKELAAAAEAAAAAAARVSAVTGGGGGGGGSTAGPGDVCLASAAAVTSSKRRSTRVKSGRPLARTPAHRRARKGLGALDETTRAMEEAFADAAGRGRPVLEALILFGASHLSPSREIYSVTFTQPFPDEGSSKSEDVLQGGEQGGDANTTRSDGGGGTGSVQGKSSLADAYSRKLVRTVVGEMSSVDFRGLGSCRVHIFLRVADAPARDPRSSEKPRSTVATAAAAAAAALSIAGVSDENTSSSTFPTAGLSCGCPPTSCPSTRVQDSRVAVTPRPAGESNSLTTLP
ncbi:unnamed protein product, partial [Pylaiella littoralis]